MYFFFQQLSKLELPSSDIIKINYSVRFEVLSVRPVNTAVGRLWRGAVQFCICCFISVAARKQQVYTACYICLRCRLMLSSYTNRLLWLIIKFPDKNCTCIFRFFYPCLTSFLILLSVIPTTLGLYLWTHTICNSSLRMISVNHPQR